MKNKTPQKFLRENAGRDKEFFYVGKKTVAIDGIGDEYVVTVIAIHPEKERELTVKFEDGCVAAWYCGATNRHRLSVCM